MSEETRYVIRRSDGKFLVIAKTMTGRRLATWIHQIDLATSWPFMTGATLAMGLDLDPALEAERAGWDVVPVHKPDPTSPKIVQFSIALPALLICLFCSSVVSAQVSPSTTLESCVAAYEANFSLSSRNAEYISCLSHVPDWNPYITRPLPLILISLRATDAMLTWDLAHRYGGREMNPFMPQNPKLIVGLLAAETAAQVWALAKVDAQHPRIARILALASVGMESWVVWHNAKQYQGR